MSSRHSQEGLGVLAGTGPRSCGPMRWEAKRKGQRLNCNESTAATQSSWPRASNCKQGRGTVTVLTVGLIPCWAGWKQTRFWVPLHAGRTQSLTLVSQRSLQGSHGRKPLPPLPCMMGCCQWMLSKLESFRRSGRSATTSSTAVLHLKEQVLLSFLSSPDWWLDLWLTEVPRSGTCTPERERC